MYAKVKLSSSDAALFRHADGRLPNVLAIGYAVLGYGGALLLLANAGPGWWPLAVLWLAHSLVMAAFLLHECTHQSLFRDRDRHRQLAVLLGWLSGSCYGDYQRIQDKHLRHHAERADIMALDYRLLLRSRPVLRWLVEAGQWLCLPTVELLMRGLVLVHPFRVGGSRRERWRVLGMLWSRGWYFALLGSFGWQVLAGYFLAWLLFLGVMGFMDAFQHTYLLRATLGEPPAAPLFDAAYEEAHTFSNLLSRRLPALNLLVLNFCYHNVHHQRCAEPWHRLPALHRQIYADDQRVLLPLARQLQQFFNHRVARVMAPATDQPGDAVGAAGVSFLTPL